MAKIGQKEIMTSYPAEDLEKKQVNLTPQGFLGVKSIVLSEERKGILSKNE